MAQTGSYEDCVSPAQVYDASGNLMEWVEDQSSIHGGMAITGGHGYLCEFCEFGSDCFLCDFNEDGHLELASDTSNCPMGLDTKWNTFPLAEARAYMGTRCCYDAP